MAWTRFRKKRDMPEGLWIKCKKCAKTLFQKEFEANLSVCVGCGWHAPLRARPRLETLLDAGTFVEQWGELHPQDLLEFVDKEPYSEKLLKTVAKTGEIEAALAGTGLIGGRPVAICAMDFGFMGGSMGAVVGEKVARTAECAMAEGIPAIVVAASGGARMHEGAISLMQMAKTSAALAELQRIGGLYIAVLTDPTTGGVTASFAALGDVILAEPGALIGFAGPRVIQETLRTELPEGFQRSEFLLDHGFIDAIVKRHDLPAKIGRLVDLLWTYSPATLARHPQPVAVAAPADPPAASTSPA